MTHIYTHLVVVFLMANSRQGKDNIIVRVQYRDFHELYNLSVVDYSKFKLNPIRLMNNGRKFFHVEEKHWMFE